MKDAVIRSAPRRGDWYLGILLYPVVAFIFTIIPFFGYCALVSHQSRAQSLLISWGAVTLAISAWAYSRDYRRLLYTLTPEALIIGRRKSATMISLSEIDSVVLGLPAKLPWWIEIQRFGGGRGLYQMSAAHWRSVPVLRLRGSRYLPLDIGSGRRVLHDFDTLVAELLRLNNNRIVGPESYREWEIRGLKSARFNMIKAL